MSPTAATDSPFPADSPFGGVVPATGRCTFLGAGPGDPGLLTLRAVEVLASADILVADPLTAAAVRSHCPSGVQVHAPGAEGPEFDLAELVREAVRSGKHVVRTVDGDPGLDGCAAEEMLGCAGAGIAFEVIPGVAQSVGVPAYAGVPLRGAAGTDVRFVEGAALLAGSPVDLGAQETTLVVRTTLGQLPATANALVSNGRKPESALSATLSGTTTRQRTFTATLATIAADLKAARVLPSPVSAPVDPATPVIAVVGEQVAHRSSHSWFETKPLFGWNVLVPRTKEQAHGLSEQLRSYGAVPQEVPTIAVEPPRTPQQMERAIKGLVTGRYEWIAFTSVNAVRAVREKFEEYGLDARAFAGIKVAAVGETTAQALVDFGVKPDLVPSGEQSAAGLLEDWPPYDPVFDPIDRVLLPRADIATETLVAGLVELGWEVDDVTAYRTVRASPPPAETREAIKGGGFDAVLFTSSSTVRNLVGIAGKPHNVTVIACIGPATAKTAEEHGLRVDVMAPAPSAAALAQALADFGAKRRDTATAAGEPVYRPSERRPGSRRKAAR
ncbi:MULTISPECIES: bifunctional uroporphyrinogen-III C-methyltransferase/uroporphyrinogen-III synthase [unclassified Streptomyces]|uniref:uroporphyrinogen-III synthase n=1 Tax=Streptomycetaceae TaxID=2062 RepID=UPI002E77577A|nr:MULTISPECIES: bifunctional uroporphyrinogen-III C-methyltransferase/uroporphyrinogen-III synthase [unclassified Streptomyces]MED7953200.1 bifunctional uroporphyrinogen-III C-methyltransferase/uroporphyrinogen-III synthase [Streptomyces sp. BE303]MEE1829066.1 bifunctional uroporphyrinogen-III C-methyltransferase/uroporphyrinogen-III synthase [Streptomyces sp. BE20]